MIKALLLDDDLGCRDVITEVFKACEIDVEAHHDPTCFLKKSDRCPVDKQCVDLILTDNNMPYMTGLDFLQRLKDMECKVPTRNRAIYSGNFTGADFDKIENLGVRFFKKPCSLDKVYDWLEEIGVKPR